MEAGAGREYKRGMRDGAGFARGAHINPRDVRRNVERYEWPTGGRSGLKWAPQGRTASGLTLGEGYLPDVVERQGGC